ncbi:hypothetical protein XU18_0340 [Perkinsela sp. CCAP 1560/4]|nr:hypothetical protein XU18_0340 [Perkinsela sp. CCAP 1560/4]|eukprot:KNH09655.1 hypothetical protein XU18_0340 [Perkinsela sp. CCAP 1560/4]
MCSEAEIQLTERTSTSQIEKGTTSTPYPHSGTVSWEILSREGVHESLRDYDDANVTFREYGNISNLLLVATPQVNISVDEERSCSIPLARLWSFYETTSGFEIPICSPNGNFYTSLYYIPLLSSINIRILETDETIAFSETLPPLDRLPLTERISQLLRDPSGKFAQLSLLQSIEVDPESYYSVLWAPIHCHAHSPQKSAGVFVTYHSIHPSQLSSHFPVANHMTNQLDMPSQLEMFKMISPKSPSADFTTPNDERTSYYCNCIGYMPFRAQSQMWYRTEKKRVYRAPLQLLIAAFILTHRSTIAPSIDHDMMYYMTHDNGMADFLHRAVFGN